MKFIKDTLTTFAVRIISTALLLGATIAIARILGPSGKGAYSLIILVPILLATIGDLGIGIANVYFLGTGRHDLSNLASNSLVSALGLGVLLAGAFVLYYFFFHPSFLQDIDPLYVVMPALSVPFILLFTYFRYIMLGEQKINQFNSVFLFQSILIMVLTLVLLLAARWGLLGATLAWAIGIILSALLCVLLVGRLTKIKLSFHPLLYKESVKFGVQGYLGTVMQLLNHRLDMLLVSIFIGVTAVGYYSISVYLAEALWYFPAAVGTIVFARTPGLRSEDANKSTPRICRNSLFITIIAALVLLGLSRIIITLFFGASFLPALEPLWILLPGTVALSICKVLSLEITGRGKPMVSTMAVVVSLVVNISLNLLFIPMWGIAGAAWASTISYSIAAIIILASFVRISKTHWFDVIILKPQDLRIYSGVLAKIGRQLHSASSNSRLR